MPGLLLPKDTSSDQDAQPHMPAYSLGIVSLVAEGESHSHSTGNVTVGTNLTADQVDLSRKVLCESYVNYTTSLPPGDGAGPDELIPAWLAHVAPESRASAIETTSRGGRTEIVASLTSLDLSQLVYAIRHDERHPSCQLASPDEWRDLWESLLGPGAPKWRVVPAPV